jgi:predicted nucleic acid-binding protein
VVVVDASVVVTACIGEEGFGPLEKSPLVAPPLLWSEVESVLHELAWRRAIPGTLASLGLVRLQASPIRAKRPKQLAAETWDVADRMGIAKTYDAEYVALARLLSCRLVTIDARLQRAAASVVQVIAPAEL